MKATPAALPDRLTTGAIDHDAAVSVTCAVSRLTSDFRLLNGVAIFRQHDLMGGNASKVLTAEPA